MPRQRLGWLGPAIVLVGVVVAALGVWYMVHAKPQPGLAIDIFPLGDHQELVVRGESGGERAFVELRDNNATVWQAIVPPYAGRPHVQAIAWSQIAVTVRVVRDHHAEIFALAIRDGTKLGGMRLAPQHGDIDPTDTGPITVTDHIRSYEIVAGKDWHQLVAVDLASGRALWFRELGPTPVTAAGVQGGLVWVQQADGKHYFRVFNGAGDATLPDAAKPALLQ